NSVNGQHRILEPVACITFVEPETPKLVYHFCSHALLLKFSNDVYVSNTLYASCVSTVSNTRCELELMLCSPTYPMPRTALLFPTLVAHSNSTCESTNHLILAPLLCF